MIECGSRRSDCRFRVSGVAQWGVADHLLRCRVEYGLAVSGSEPCTVDVQLVDLCEGNGHGCHRFRRMMSAAFRAKAMAGALVLARINEGMIDVSQTRSPSTPRTRSSGSTTERSSAPMRQVP